VLSVGHNASDLPSDPVIVLTNPDEDCSPEAFHVLIAELLDGPEPETESIDAGAALRAWRVDTSE